MYIWNNQISSLATFLQWLSFDKLILFTDDNVIKLYWEQMSTQLSNFNYHTIIIPPWEKSKTQDVFFWKSTEILSLWITSKTVMILFWWGVVGNIWGLIASTLLRWIRFIHIPTTVLSQSDSCMGGKQGINTEYGKNTIGTIAEPEFSVVDYSFLQTLPRREILNGVAESIKHAMIQDAWFYHWFTSHNTSHLDMHTITYITEKTLHLKLQIMEMESTLKWIWSLMKYWHEVGHALEGISHRYLHGEGVSIGICFTVYLEYKIGIKSINDFLDTKALFTQWGLPSTWNHSDTQYLLMQLKKERTLTDEWIHLIHLNTYWEYQNFTQESSKIHLSEKDFIKYFYEYIQT